MLVLWEVMRIKWIWIHTHLGWLELKDNKIWKQPKYPSVDELCLFVSDLKKKDLLPFICYNMNESRGYYAKWNKPDK